MKNELLKIGIRHNAIYVPSDLPQGNNAAMSSPTMEFVSLLKKSGFSLSEELLWAVNKMSHSYKILILKSIEEVLRINYNWTPLVKGWDTPIGESSLDHLVTLFANIFYSKNGTTLACGNLIPEGTFPLERYNGCPFCGTPFVFDKLKFYGQGSKLKILELWSDESMQALLKDLLESKTALDETQKDTLKVLMKYFPLPQCSILMKETRMFVIDFYIENDNAGQAQSLFENPNDIMRYLWYKKTGLVQLIEPKAIIKKAAQNNQHLMTTFSISQIAAKQKVAELKLKYSRKECLMVANWLNELNLNAYEMATQMHPKRGMWVRFIRALRLSEYSKKNGMEKLSELMDVFYNKKYEVWAGKVNSFRLKNDSGHTFKLLKQRPGLFARSLFSNMLWFGADETLAAFTEVIDAIPARLILTLNMYAENYFVKDGYRNIKPLGGNNKKIRTNPMLNLYESASLDRMKNGIEDLCIKAIAHRFAAQQNDNWSIYIDPTLFNIPLSIGDRSETVQDLPTALMGTKFPIEGNEIRLYMQWGTSLPAQHLDMDLSCHLAFQNGNNEVCSYYNLVTHGCKHSGDIRVIPNRIGTAEYININIKELQNAKVQYVTFTCNAYSAGAISPNLVVGWMDSKFPMSVSETSGVAYDPSCVIHQVRITQKTHKGLVFGVLDVKCKEIIWLEMSFQGQTVNSLDFESVKALLSKLNSKLSIGNLLTIKAHAQKLTIVDTADADEIYDVKWAANPATVTKLFLD